MSVAYLICAAGEGARFHGMLGALPKPLIKMRGKTLLEWSVSSLPLASGDRLIFLVQQRHGVRAALEKTFARLYPSVAQAWRELDRPTRGQLETALMAEPLVPAGHAVAAYNCDTYFESATLQQKMADPANEGIIPCAFAEGDAWSFCQLEKETGDRVIAVREKVRISNWATAGLYYFRDARRFFDTGQAALTRCLRGTGECYIAPLYQEYIDNRLGRVVIDRLPVFKPMGTPEQMATFWNVTPEELRRENAD